VSRVAGRLLVKAENSISRFICTLWRSFAKIDVPYFPVSLQQGTEVFSARGILSSCATTDVVVFVHLPVDMLRK
jgi:hypothetical protein